MKFEVTTEEATLIMVALGHMSFNKVAGLIVKLQTQSNHQDLVRSASAVPEPSRVAAGYPDEPNKPVIRGKAGHRKIKLSLASTASTADSMDKIGQAPKSGK